MPPIPDDLVRAIDQCRRTLEPGVDADWSARAGGIEWTCHQTLEHLCGLSYATQLATLAKTFRPLALRVAPAAPTPQLLDTMHTMALVLAEVARAATPTARAFHPAGMATAPGGSPWR